MPDPTPTQPTTTPAPKPDGPSALDAALDEYVRSSDPDLQLDAELDRPLLDVAAERERDQARPTAETAAPAEKPAHPPWVLEQARHYFAEDEIAGMSPKELREAVLEIKRYDSAAPRTSDGPASTSGSPSAAPSPTPPAGVSPAAPRAASVPPEGPPPAKVDWGKDPDEWIDPELREKLDGVLSPIVRELAELRAVKAQFEAVVPHIAEQVREKQVSAIDRAFAGLNPAAFGSGPLAGCTPEEARRRRAVVMMAQEEVRQGGDFFEALAANAKAMFGGAAAKPRAAAEPEPEPEPGQRRNADGTFAPAAAWEAGQVQRPTGRKPGPEPKGPKKAAAAVSELLRAAATTYGGGRSVNGTLDDELDGFPE